MTKSNLIIIGDGETAEVAYEYLQSTYEIKSFLVEKAYLKKTDVFGIPVHCLEDIQTQFPSHSYKVFVAVSFVNTNKLRQRLFDMLTGMGYQFVSFIHPSVQLGKDAVVGSNCLVLENVVLQRKVTIGNNVFIWSGSVIAHQSTIANHAFIASGVMISGFCEVGNRAFLGVGSKLMDYIKIADDCTIGGGAFVNRNTEAGKTYVGVPARLIKK